MTNSYLERYLNLKNTAAGQKEYQLNAGAIAFLASVDEIRKNSPLVADKIIQELKDQRQFLKLIASENYSSLAVQLAMGNLLTDKYAEGVSGRRFYAGCDNVDAIETDAVEKAKQLFQAEHAYVQPHSGADANMIAYWAVLTYKVQDKELEKLGSKNISRLTEAEYEKIRQKLINQKIMGMGLGSGGHLTHGYRFNMSSKIFKSVPYEVDPKTGVLDYKALAEQVKKEKPLILIAGYSAYPRLIDCAILKEIAHSAGAVLLVDMAHFAGLVAGKALTGNFNPAAFADIITSTTHKTLRGPRGGLILCKKYLAPVVDKGCPLVIGGPLPHAVAAKAVAFQEALKPEFKTYARQIIKNAQALAEGLQQAGAAVLTGGTDNHMVLVNVFKSFQITGRAAEKALRKAFITVNRNSIPNDQNGPFRASGIRIGTPALTTLGMKELEMHKIAEVIAAVLKNTQVQGQGTTEKIEVEKKILDKARNDIKQLLQKFPLYPEIVID